MEYIKVTKVDNVTLHKRGQSVGGTLHLTTHHLIFTLPPPAPGEKPQGMRELWLCYPMIEKVEFNKGSAMLYLQEPADSDNETDSSNKNGNGNSNIEIDFMQRSLNLLSSTTMLSSDITHNTGNGSSGVDKLNPLLKGANLRIRCRDFTYLAFDFPSAEKCADVFESILKLTCIDNIEKLYAFIYSPVRIELPFNSWNDYDVMKEFERQGLYLSPASAGNSGKYKGSDNWRLSTLNKTYKLSPSYPGKLLVPKSISDTILSHSVRFRSKNRFPALTYYYKYNGCTIVRCSQPLVGLKQNRSFQDEKLLFEIFKTNGKEKSINLIVDARPLTNAIAQTALGAGTENMDNYDNCKKIFLNIDNIHVMRDSLSKITDVLKDGDISKNITDKEPLLKSNWINHISNMLNGVDILVKSIHLNNNHLVVHCSDGWDRTSQICALVELCIDPFYRTIDGFAVLVEKEWLSFGHRFNERCGHLQSETKFYNHPQDSYSNQATSTFKQFTQHFKHSQHIKLQSPVFHQFLDCIYQMQRQYPTAFEFNERFLRRLIYHLYSCQFGTFLFNCERERVELKIDQRTRSVWDYFKSRKPEFSNPQYVYTDEVIFPKTNNVRFWYQLFGKQDEELNDILDVSSNSKKLNTQAATTTNTPQPIAATTPAQRLNESHNTLQMDSQKTEESMNRDTLPITIVQENGQPISVASSVVAAIQSYDQNQDKDNISSSSPPSSINSESMDIENENENSESHSSSNDNENDTTMVKPQFEEFEVSTVDVEKNFGKLSI